MEKDLWFGCNCSECGIKNDNDYFFSESQKKFSIYENRSESAQTGKKYWICGPCGFKIKENSKQERLEKNCPNLKNLLKKQ